MYQKMVIGCFVTKWPGYLSIYRYMWAQVTHTGIYNSLHFHIIDFNTQDGFLFNKIVLACITLKLRLQWYSGFVLIRYYLGDQLLILPGINILVAGWNHLFLHFKNLRVIVINRSWINFLLKRTLQWPDKTKFKRKNQWYKFLG